MVVLVAEGEDPFPRTGTIAVPDISLALASGIVVCGVGSGVT